ncbi:GmrSD restriction endonuclease domain-containing protein [Knoellia sp. CPCC 206450]|uniref:GmrSD restriction endonuclease domain-containing protein n=1 Tax=Knoellia tibetensis TaxID=3404798 RepID=UPI003B42975B
MKVSQVLDLIDSGDIALPEFQRGYVWNRDQVRGLLSSLYRGYPVGSFMTWNTKAEGASARGGPVAVDGTVKLLLDGQQRATTLYGVIRGAAPKFFEGHAKAFTGLHFNLDDESFEFYAPAKMKDNPTWIDVTQLMKTGLGGYWVSVNSLAGGDAEKQQVYIDRLNRIGQIANHEVHIEEVTGADKTVDVVVDIFNRVNSGGTKLSKGDLALAKIGASWPEARQEINKELARWKQSGFDFRIDWLLRGVNAIVTGEALFSALDGVQTAAVQQGLKDATKYLDGWLNVVSGRLGLDHDRVLFSKFALLILARYTHLNGGQPPTAADRDKLLYWFIHTGMWGRFAGSTETVLNQDLHAVETHGIDGLIENLKTMRGDLTVRPADFAGNSLGARFYPVLYLMTRTMSAQDWGDGTPLSAHMLGKLSGLQVHHIFPKAQLYKANYPRGEVNAVANFCFLTQGTNLNITSNPPAAYMPGIRDAHPGALESQWVPMDSELWKIENYAAFLEARRELLAGAANSLLDGLLRGPAHEAKFDDEPSAWSAPSPAGNAVSVDESDADVRTVEVQELIAELRQDGYSEPQTDVEVVDPDTGRVLAVAEAFWQAGLQEGLGQPAVLELDTDNLDESGLQALGYQVFTTCASLREYVRRHHEETA